MLLIGAGALYDSIGRRRVGILRYFAIGFFSLILTFTFLPVATLTAYALNELHKSRGPEVPTSRVRIPYISAVVEQKSPDLVVLFAVVLNNNSDQEYLLSPKAIDVCILGPHGGAGAASEISDSGGHVIPVAVLRPKTTEAIQPRIVFHQADESVFAGKRNLCLDILLKGIAGDISRVHSDWEIDLSAEEPQVLRKAAVQKRITPASIQRSTSDCSDPKSADCGASRSPGLH